MCQYCLQSPCHPMCPNAPEPRKVYTCSCCDEAIEEGEEYIKIEDENYHLDCAAENSIDLFINVYGARKCIAEAGEHIDEY